MEHRIPRMGGWEFFIYRRSDVDLTEEDRPTGITWRPDPEPQGEGIQGPAVRPTHMIIKGLSEDWQINTWQLAHSEVKGNPNHAVWECICECLLGAGIVIITAPRKRESAKVR